MQMDNGKKTLVTIAGFVLIVLAVVLFLFGGKSTVPYDRDTLVRIEGEGIAAELPQGAQKQKADGVPFYCVWQDGLLAAGYDEAAAIEQAGYDADMTLEQYAQICAEDAPTDVTVGEDAHGNVFFSYEINSNGTPLFYYVAFKRDAQRLWTCNFVCKQELAQEYEPYFALWASKLELIG